MGYTKKDLQILGGGFNLLPPVDKVPQTDYLLAQNWRCDRAGRLVSRAGYPIKFSIAGPTYAHSAAVYGGVEGDYYVAANAASGTNPGAVYFRFGTSAIVSGLSGDRCGMVAMAGFMWIMDAQKQGKHNSVAGYQNWGIAPPTNPCTPADSGVAVASGPSGTYQFYVTFATSDQSCESNPGPVSASFTAVAGNSISVSGIPVSTDSQVGARNLYATGGTLNGAYLVGTVNDNVTTTYTWQTSNSYVINQGVQMPTDNDLPPAGKGLVGPHFERLYSWSGNTLYYSKQDQPQYWPGAADSAVGNWVLVGADGESIMWCTYHGNVLLIYKERSIWRLVGDPEDGGYIEQLVDGIGLASPFSVVSAGPVDYFVAPTGLYINTIDRVDDITGPLRTLFTSSSTNTSHRTPPGSIIPAPGFLVNSIYAYDVSLGYALGMLYVAYRELSTTANASVLLTFHEQDKRWMYHRDGLGTIGFRGFLFDGVVMAGLTGDGSTKALAYNLADFRGFYTQDEGATSIRCVYQSHYEDCGLPDTPKMFLEVVVDAELAGDTATVYVGFDNGNTVPASAGTLSGTGRRKTSFTMPNNGTLATNISVLIDVTANAAVQIHNVYIYYYEEVRASQLVSSIPTDLGLGQVKQAKELQLDIDASNGAAVAHLHTDLPGNVLAGRQTCSIAQGGRALLKFPFATLEGFLWRLAVYGNGQTFKLYGARLLMRPIGTYVEAYEAAAGFVWDSQEQLADSTLIKRFRELRLEIDTFNAAVIVTLLTDLPGNAQASRYATTVNTGIAGRRFVNLPLPGGTATPIEGRMCRLQISGSAKFVLYGASVESMPVGVYVEAYEATAGAVYDSRELDFGIPAVKELRELALDIETTGSVAVTVIGSESGTLALAANAAGRQQVMLPLNVNAAGGQFCEGRLARVIISGSSAFRLYGAQFLARAFGQYMTASESAAGALWDSTELDLGTQTAKQIKALELDIWAYGAFTVTMYTDQPGNLMASRSVSAQASTGGRAKIQIPLSQGGVPDNYLTGRNVRVTVTSASAFKLFGARIDVRPLGMYVEGYEAAAGAVWDSTPLDLGSPSDKYFDQLRFEMDSDATVNCAVYTDLPGEAYASRATAAVTTGATSRHWATMNLAAGTATTWGVEGRGIRAVLSSASGFRLYRAQVRMGRIGRYLGVAQTLAQAAAGGERFATLECDFNSERTKALKQVEVDLIADGSVAVTVLTDQGGTMAQAWTSTVAVTAGRKTLVLPVTPGVRGKLIRVQLASTLPARIFRLRVRTRPLNEDAAQWSWEMYPLEESDVVPQWVDMPVPETPAMFSWVSLPVPPTDPKWDWAPVPVLATPPQWSWSKILSVAETPDTWTLVDLPMGQN